MNRFEGSVALVTGSAGGMGRAIALAFAAEGAAVVTGDVAAPGGEETVEMIRQAGGTASFLRTDVSDAAAVEALVGAVIAQHGQLDHAVNAAAIEGETVALADVADADFDRMMAVNTRSVFLCLKHELRAMLAGDGPHAGTIVNIASTNSFRPQPHQSSYTASKFAVLGLTRSAAIDYAPLGVRINAICPGAIDTPMLRGAIERRGGDVADVTKRLSLLGRFGTSDEIAKAALWLSSDESSYTVGHALAVDAGYLAR